MQAAIFDMDGLLIHSEPFWKQAERAVFSALGVPITPQETDLTAAMTTREVTEFWYQKYPWTGLSHKEVEQRVINQVSHLVQHQGEAMAGVRDILQTLTSKGVKIALATNSPKSIIPSVFKRLDIGHFFLTYSSADDVQHGKPKPDIYLLTLSKLGVRAQDCLSFEDSVGGIKASLAAGIKSIAIPHSHEFDDEKFNIASHKLRSLSEFDYSLGRQLLSA
ncbi:hexitol phosphatase HxpB [Marinomonas posidonica]|uniref:hexitol phosphatase HxpB n=1 Tax=Marinomonas posidonica TaxID=936476 RepID=UPI0037352F2D